MDMYRRRDVLNELRRLAAWTRQVIHERAERGKQSPLQERQLDALDEAIPALAEAWGVEFGRGPEVDDAAGQAVIS